MGAGLIVSIDFELNWGYRNENRPLTSEQIDRGLTALKSVLDRYEIHSTWAIVGQLFFNQDKLGNHELYDTRSWIASHLENDKKVEIGSHTFEHIFLKESTQDIAVADFTQMQQLETTIDSIVFPRNQYDTTSLHLAQQADIQYYRSVLSNSLLQTNKMTHQSRMRQLAKRIAELLPLPKAVEVRREKEMVSISDSRFFRFFPDSWWGNLLTTWYRQLWRYELRQTLKNGQAYHIWLHPHNLMSRPEGIEELDAFFQYFRFIADKYNATSYTMRQYAEHIS
ncbi:MAG: polysaccharide deacetylase family protein [Bacteroidota bacterium]